ncbi:uncharacterized protein LOC115742849 [Rhodamnia argentea]|uniref:Uncharacterized protein LOC115742849 n=1 Tax=Rhodamnia argentea TaxID=178133 RepID=A0A8B8PEV8_9MYRT|nr:uncharacterized protein LOC115742849 [Rhodamnia argentea]
MEMESPTISAQAHRLSQPPQTLSPCGSGRRSSSASNSPEFEFWMVGNPIFPQPELLSADELFVDGVLLPLQLLHLHQPDPPDPVPQAETAPEGPEPPALEADLTNIPDPDPEPGPQLTPTSSTTSSKRWRDIFKKSEKKSTNNQEEKPPSSSAEKDKDKKKEKKSQGRAGSGSAELNINLWPFSRSRSAGNSGARPRLSAFGGPSARKVSSAPCSRSNSAGDSKSRKWPSSPGRVGVHLGRNSPVWQVRRGAPPAKVPAPAAAVPEPVARSVDKVVLKSEAAAETHRSKAARGGAGGGANKARVLNLNVPMCIGYRHHFSCRSDDNSAIRVVGADCGDTSGGGESGTGAGRGDNGGSSNNIFNLRSLFTKKVH